MDMNYATVALTGGRPIPGQSLTSDPSNPAPYEKPPKFTSVHEASRSIFEYFIEPETYSNTMELLADDVPLMDIVQTFVFTGFKEGQWNPDLMLMLVEPIAYIILALAERAGIDPVIYAGEDEDEAADLAMLGTTFQKERLKNMEEFSKEQIALPEGVLPREITEQIKTIQPPESLLAKQPEETTEAGEESLLAEPVVEEQV
jgi:hypothetical protein